MKTAYIVGAVLVVAAVSYGVVVAQNGGEENVAPTINENFRTGNVDVSRWVESFSGESREVFVAREEVSMAIGLEPGQTVADVGAGTGIYVRLFARDVGPTGRVYAVDIAQEFLDYIDGWAEEESLDQVETILGEDRSPNLAPNSVDVIFSSDTYHHFEYPVSMLNALHAALRDGGEMIVVDYERTPEREEHVRADKETVIQEIEDSGFRFVEEVEILGFSENYFLRFAKN